jgi:PAS domain S-box-containing protein
MAQPDLKKIHKPKRKSTVGREIFFSGIAFSFLMILIFGFLLSYHLYESEMNRARSSIKKSNQTITVFIEAYFTEIINTINALADNPEVRDVFVLPVDAMERVLSQYRTFGKANKNIVYIYSGYENGMLLINDYIPPEDYDPVNRPWYIAAIESSPNISVGVPYQEIKSSEWLISTSKLLAPDPQGTRGVLTIDCSIKEIAELLMEKHEFDSEYSFVTSGNGEVIIHHRADQIGKPFQEFANRIGLAVEGEFTFGLNGVNYMAFYRSVKSTGWYVVTVFESKEIIHPIIIKMLTNLALIVLLAVLLGLAQSYFLGKSLAEPMVELTKAMHRIVKGEETYQGLYRFPDNEIGFMAESIGQLARQEIHRKTRELEIIIESTTDGILVVDNSGKIIRTNTNFNRMWGLSIGETENAGFQQVVDQIFLLVTEPSLLIPMFDDFWKNDRICNKELQLKDTRIFEAYSCPFMEYQHIIGRLWSFRDITQRKRAEETLRESESRYRNLLEVAPVGITVFSEGKVVFVNPAGAQILGADSDEEIVHMPISKIVHPEMLNESLNRLQRILTGEKGLYPVENVYLKLDGTPIDVEVMATALPYDGKPAVQVIVKDITKRKRVEKALRESEERFAKAFKSSPAPLVISEIDTGVFIDVNDRWVEMLGYTRQEQIGRSSKEVGIWAKPSECDRIIENLRKMGYFKNEPIEFKNKSGGSIQALWSGEALSLAGRQVMLSMIYDETERKNAEKERENLQIQLLQAQKMDLVGRLAGGVAHDFNNMLGVILGHAELALEQVEPGFPIFNDLKEIQTAAERSADLTRQLLGFARKQTAVPRVLDLNDTLEGMLKMLRRLIGENIDLNWLPGATLWPVKMDPSQIDQILVNLCVNARDAFNGVGKITIETDNVIFDKVWFDDHDGLVSGDYVILAVSDNGCGMNKETLGKLFEPFFTTKGIGKGTGLGLANVYGIVRQNDGFIKVHSEPDHGTTFKIYLPRYSVKLEQAVKDEQGVWVAHGQETVLLVEDEPSILKLTTLMLEKLGYKVLAALTPGEAIHLAELHPGEIHLLMTDVIMPEMNGRDLADKLIFNYPHLKLLFMSGYTADVIAHHGVLDEGVHFIRKPFSKMGLAARVREALEK